MAQSDTIHMRLSAVVLLSAAAAAAAEPDVYVRKGTWQESMFASREALARREAAAAAKAGGKVQLGTWHATGPLRATNGLATVLFPEKGVDLTAAAGGKKLWTRQAGWRDGTIVRLPAGRDRIVYVFRTVRAAAAGAIDAYIGCDDHMMVWLNGKNIHTCVRRHGVRPNEHKIALPLRKGDNELLMKIRDTGGVFAFYFSTDPQPAGGGGTDAAAGLWQALGRDFPDTRAARRMRWEQADRIWQIDWDENAASRLARRYAARAPAGLKARAARLASAVKTPADLAPLRELYYRGKQTAELAAELKSANMPALRRAIEDLTATFPRRYGRKGDFLKRLDALEKPRPDLVEAVAVGEPDAIDAAERLLALRREALLANPLLDFDRLLLVKRSMRSPRLGLPANWQGNCSLPRSGYDDEIAVLSPPRPGGKLTTLYKPPPGRFVGDVELHFGADRLMFSMPSDKGRWQVFEVRSDGSGLRQVTPGDQDDVDNYDACYLPDGRIIYSSTACMAGVPCVRGSSRVANLYLLDPATKNIRQLCFDQDHNWCATMLPNGRVLYTRWEYSDIPHAFSRILFHMNPDGTGQAEYYGSNSYWPNSLFYARPVPGSESKFVGIVTGHHGVARIGEMVLFDQAVGRHEADGAIQRIGQWGRKVEPIILDRLVDRSWPKFLHPYPLSDRYFLASAQMTGGSAWAIYLVDVFDNMLKLCEAPGYAMLEPMPFRKRPRPPIIGDRVDVKRKDAVVYLVDVYAGAGLRGVPRGTVKSLRLFTYHFAYHGMGGQQDRIGLDGPWDVKRILGTVGVCDDGSACFRVPANTPISVQPLDEKGQAVQIMRSWLTAMPGESLSCVGCHERQSLAPRAAPEAAAFGRPPEDIRPWYGPARGFGFKREVQPVLDKYCLGCHDGSTKPAAGGPDGRAVPDFTARPPVAVHPIKGQHGRADFSPSYYALRRFVRTPTIESDIHLLPPWEFHAESTKLVQMLRKGHHNVKLDAEAWDRLITWIDLGAPAHGTWHENVGMKRVERHRDRRRELRKLYAGVDEDPEAVPAAPAKPVKFVPPDPLPDPPAGAVACPGWPFDAAEAKRRQSALGNPARTVDLGGGVTMKLALIPPGRFVMGDPAGHRDEGPTTRVKIARAFWMGTCEVTNRQYARFDATHDSRLEHGEFLQFSTRERGDPLNGAEQPVLRVSWHEAAAFCRWLSRRTGRAFDLPTEAQWEYACRAGSAEPMSYGRPDTDHAKLANLADISIKQMKRLGWGLPYGAIPAWHPTDGRIDDKSRVSADVGSYAANAWGLHDMHGNVAEWTRSAYRPYPYRADDGRNAAPAGSPADRRVVRGGSWYDRPRRARSAFRLSYRPAQNVYDVGFRVVCGTNGPAKATKGGRPTAITKTTNTR